MDETGRESKKIYKNLSGSMRGVGEPKKLTNKFETHVQTKNTKHLRRGNLRDRKFPKPNCRFINWNFRSLGLGNKLLRE